MNSDNKLLLYKYNYLMNLQRRIRAFSSLGKFLKQDLLLDHEGKIMEVEVKNSWFTRENIKKALRSWQEQLSFDILSSWVIPYKLEELKLEGKILKKKATEDKGIE